MAASAASGAAAASAAQERRATAAAFLKRICEAAGLVPKQAITELLQLEPRAQVFFHRHGCNIRQAWGRAAAEYPELESGRELVGVFLIWKTSTGNVERRFRVYSEHHTPQRASLLETSVQDCMIADQAPSSTELRQLLEHPPPDKNYLEELDRLRAGMFPGGWRITGSAAFSRKRAAELMEGRTQTPPKDR